MNLKSLCQRSIDKFQLPAVSLSVVSASEVLGQELCGVRVHGKPERVTPDDYFHIGSCSKSVLAVIAAKLIEQKKISWQTRFLELFPELKPTAKPAYADITLQDLFMCRAGIQGYSTGEMAFPDLDPQNGSLRHQFAEYLLQQPPAASQGKDGGFDFLYSNAGYMMASLMLEKVAEVENYEQLIDKYLHQEMGIDSILGFPNKHNPDQPYGHTIKSGKEIEIFDPEHEYAIPHLITPAGDLSMKPAAFTKYIQFHLAGLQGQDNFISAESYQYIHFSQKGFSLGVGKDRKSVV